MSIGKPQSIESLLGYRLRRDLQWQQAGDRFRRVWIASDPLARKIFRFGNEERQLLIWLDDQSSIAALQARFAKMFAPRSISTEEIVRFIQSVAGNGLLLATVRPPQFIESKAATKTGAGFVGWLSGLPWRILSAKISLFNPDNMLHRVVKYTDWLLSYTAVRVWILLILIVALIVASRLPEVLTQWPAWSELSSPQLWIGLGAIFLVTRTIHELGHALTCVRLGAACVDCGVLMMMGVLSPYVDVTDSWRLADRWQRAAVAAAGVYVELILAAVAAILWWLTQDGWLHTIAWQVMLVCTVSTIIFNVNPLMRYDGYFLLCDLIDVPNLRDAASHSVRRVLTTYLLGMQRLPLRRKRPIGDAWLVVYGLSSQFYRLILTLGIAFAVVVTLTSWNLHSIGISLAIAILFSSFGAPLIRAFNSTIQGIRQKRVSPIRSIVAWTVAIAISIFGLLIPIPQRLACHGSIEPKQMDAVHSKSSGQLRLTLGDIDVAHGLFDAAIEADEVLFQLENVDLSLSERIANLSVEGMTQSIDNYSRQQNLTSPAMFANQIADLNRRRSMAEVERDIVLDRQARLTIAAPVSGRFIPDLAPLLSIGSAPERTSQNQHRHYWTSTASIDRYVPRETRMGWIVEGSELVVRLRIGQAEIGLFHQGDLAHVRLPQIPWEVCDARVKAISNQPDEIDAQNPKQYGVPKASSMEICQVQYLVELEFVSPPKTLLLPFGSADVVIFGPSRSLIKRAHDYLSRNFR